MKHSDRYFMFFLLFIIWAEHHPVTASSSGWDAFVSYSILFAALIHLILSLIAHYRENVE